eukprot:1151075-Pelagomonas_calceolata.AAC.6
MAFLSDCLFHCSSLLSLHRWPNLEEDAQDANMTVYMNNIGGGCLARGLLSMFCAAGEEEDQMVATPLLRALAWLGRLDLAQT